MHLGNVFAALMSWLSAKSKGGSWLLRIEDLDPQRSRTEYARLIEDDLQWLGLSWDEGGLDSSGPCAPYSQSLRGAVYQRYFDDLRSRGLLYPCHCTRADIMATQAPHESDGRLAYKGTCRPAAEPPFAADWAAAQRGSARLYVPDADIEFADSVFGPQRVNLKRHCGDFVVRRADGAWAYQLAVVVDDALMGVTEVVRGCDLLLSAAQQAYIYRLFGWEAPAYAHVPLICNAAGQRLSKRDASMGMDVLRGLYSPERVIGWLGSLAGLVPCSTECTAPELARVFDWSRVKPEKAIIV